MYWSMGAGGRDLTWALASYESEQMRQLQQRRK